MHQPRRQHWVALLIRSRYFLYALLLHMVIFLFVGAIVIFQAPPRHNDFEALGQPTIDSAPPAPPVANPTPDSGGGTPSESVAVSVPTTSAAPDLISTTLPNNDFTVATSLVPGQNGHDAAKMFRSGVGMGPGDPGSKAGTGSPFGSILFQGSGMEGHFFDLKQTTDKLPTNVDLEGWITILRNFVNQGSQESQFAKYFQSPKPIYATSLAIPVRPTEEGPKAFDMDKDVQGGMWAVSYQGNVIPPSTGTYTFVGFADDIMAVIIDGEIVFDGGIAPMTKLNRSKVSEFTSICKTYPYIWSPDNYGQHENTNFGLLRIGKPFHAQAGLSVNMKVLISDSGGDCCFYLFIMKEGVNYETLTDGTPKLPFFHLSNAPFTPPNGPTPPYSSDPSASWTMAPY